MIGRTAWRPILRGTKITAFLLGITAMSVVIALVGSRNTHAVSLFDTLKCTFKFVFILDCDTKQSSTQSESQPQPQPQSQPQPKSAANEVSESSKPDQLTVTSDQQAAPQAYYPDDDELLSMNEQVLQPVPAVPELPEPPLKLASINGNYTDYKLYAYYSSQSAIDANSVKDVPLRASSEGWKLFGIAWYWWLIIGGGALAGGYTLRKLILKQKLI